MDEMHDNGRTIDAAGAAQTLTSLFDAGSHSAPATPQSTLRSTAPLRGAPSGRGAADAPAPNPRREALPQTGAREPNFCREALPLLGEVARSAEGVSGVESGAGEKRESGLKSPCHSETRSQTGRGNPRPLTPHINTVSTQRETDCHVGLCPPRNDGGGRKPVAPISATQNVENGAPTNQSCHSETSSQTGRGNPRPLTPHINTVSTQRETDCHVGLCPPRNDGGGRKPVAPISATQNVENGAPTNQSCHSETSSQTGRGNPHPPSPSPPLLRAHFARLCAEADALHRADPGFDLDSALRDPAFVRLTAPDVGVPVADAWYALHRREYAETLRRESLEQAAAAVASGSLRPREGGRASGGELLGTDPRRMTAAQRAELRDRIKRGERVYPR